MSTRILLIRHGETDWNRIRRFQGRSDLPLNRRGKEQARALALRLKGEAITAIHSSPLARAIETARIVKTFHPSIHLEEEEGLVEMDLGDFEGMEAPAWAEKYPEFLKAWREDPSSVRMPGGETFGEVQARALNTLERIVRSYPRGSTLLISSHNFVNRAILCHAMKVPLADLRKLKQDTAALNILYIEGDELRAETVNESAHLPEQ
jgi:broad specificity phosphatase PhoE